MVDGVCLEEKGKFEGKSEVSLPLENRSLRGANWAADLGLVSKLKWPTAGRQRCSSRHNQDIFHLEGALEFDSALLPPTAPPPQEPLDSVPSPEVWGRTRAGARL